MEGFGERFAALTGFAPYRWQVRLFERLCSGCALPDAVDLPTGLGKTSVIPIWLLALAEQTAGRRAPDAPPLPRRLVYVVDRRAVVDQATAVADAIAARLAEGLDAALAEPPGAEARRTLAAIRADLKLNDGEALPVSTLRGQHQDNRLWTEAPHAPAIVVGTVDMVGSRLGFEGYGVSRRMRPVHAGLIGVDSLLVLDEAHLVAPFEAFVRGAAAMAEKDRLGAPDTGLTRPLQVMSLSATGRDSGGEVFRLQEHEREDDGVKGRLNAIKNLRLLTPASLKDKQAIQRLSDEAWRLGEGGARVLVFTNSRALAQDVAKALTDRARKKVAYGSTADLVALLVGERRVYERLALTGDGPEGRVFGAFRSGGAPDAQGRPLFLVATSAGEVGVDMDADHLVCDLVAWERMVQRFGRVNRRSSDHAAEVSVIPISFKEREGEDVVSDPDLARHAAVFGEDLWPPVEGVWDVSPGRLVRLKEEAGRSPELERRLLAATTPPPLRPPLTRATVEAWSLTSLETHPGRPKIGPWLRGWDKVEPQTAVVWRRLFPLGDQEPRVNGDLKAFFKAAPPHVTEMLEAPSWRVADWLQARAKALAKPKKKAKAAEDALAGAGDEEPADGASPPGADDGAPEAASRFRHPPVAFVLGSDRELVAAHTARQLEDMNKEALARELANGTLVVDARFGGLDEGLLDDRHDALPPTLDGEAGWGATPQAHAALLRAAGLYLRFNPEQPTPEPGRADGSWKVGYVWRPPDLEGGAALWVIQWRGKGGRHPGDPAVTARPQALFGEKGHLADAGCAAKVIADGLELKPQWASVLILAAQAHDLGKDRKVWQTAMGAKATGRPWAKTEGGGNPAALSGYRHEFGSVLDVIAEEPRCEDARAVHAAINALPDDQRDLTLHLIAAHHGHARPTIKPWDPGEACGDGLGAGTAAAEPPSRSAEHAREIALRFARLQRAWGPWGLAWWESLLRAADWAASRKLNEEASPHG